MRSTTLTLLLLPSIAFAGNRCFTKSCDKSYCVTCNPVKIETKTTVQQRTEVKNNLVMPPRLEPMQFVAPEPAINPQPRRQFQFARNIPPYQPPQRQVRRRQIRFNQGNAFIVQNVVTSGTDIEATVINNGFQKSKALSKTTIEKKETIIKEDIKDEESYAPKAPPAGKQEEAPPPPDPSFGDDEPEIEIAPLP